LGAPDSKRPVRRSMWWLRRFFFVGLSPDKRSSACEPLILMSRSSNSELKFYHSDKQEKENK
jgi:hypothetical protein